MCLPGDIEALNRLAMIASEKKASGRRRKTNERLPFEVKCCDPIVRPTVTQVRKGSQVDRTENSLKVSLRRG